MWVIRKGYTPAFPGQEGFVGATMGEASVILRAECNDRDCDFWVTWRHYQHEREKHGLPVGARFTLCPRHPDGNMSKRRGRLKDGRIDFGSVQRELAGSGIELRGGAADEAPDAYKRLDAHGDTIEILHRLTPIGVAMAGADTFDPYKD